MAVVYRFVQEGQEEHDILCANEEEAQKLKSLLENKKLGNMWIENWPQVVLRIETEDK